MLTLLPCSTPADNKVGWCAAPGDLAPWVEITLNKPMAVSTFGFQFFSRIDEHDEKMYTRNFDLLYAAAIDSSHSLRTFAEVGHRI